MKREMKLAPYNEHWSEQFEEIKTELTAIFGDLALDIRHFGSTSIKGMSAKPIIDVMVIVRYISGIDALNERMQAAGYVAKGENGIKGRRYFQKFTVDGVNHAQHIHCYEKDNPHAADELMFRDYLSENQEAFDAYLKVKTEAAEKYRFSPVEYTDYKSACVREIMEKARQYYKKGKAGVNKIWRQLSEI
jgi:GrpB-like predicted nucleotidyltransferase (UPF0157 family)